MKKLIPISLIFVLILSGCGILTKRPTAQDLADPDGQFVEVDGAEIYYVEYGNPQDPTIIFVHGFAASTISWRLNWDAVVEAGYHAVALDRPGYGLSDKSLDIDFSHANQADLIVGFMDELDIETATVVGHSQGGNVVGHFAVRHPERLDNLVIVAGALLPSSESSSDLSFLATLSVAPPELLQELISRPIGRLLLELGLNYVFDRDAVAELMVSAYGTDEILSDELIDLYYRALQTEGWEAALIDATLESDGNVLSEEQIASIETTTLILWGDEDTWVPIDSGYALDELMPNSEMIIFEGIGHAPMDTIPETFNEGLISFLDAQYK